MTMLCLQHTISNVPTVIMHSAVPDKVRGVRFGPSPDNKSLSVEWSRPQSDARILYYEIQYRRQAGSHSWQGPVTATTEMVILQSRLIPSATYGVQVRAVSAIGKGPYSSEETVKSLFQHTHAHKHTHTYTHTHTHMHTHTSKHTHTHTRTHLHTPFSPLFMSTMVLGLMYLSVSQSMSSTLICLLLLLSSWLLYIPIRSQLMTPA